MQTNALKLSVRGKRKPLREQLACLFVDHIFGLYVSPFILAPHVCASKAAGCKGNDHSVWFGGEKQHSYNTWSSRCRAVHISAIEVILPDPNHQVDGLSRVFTCDT